VKIFTINPRKIIRLETGTMSRESWNTILRMFDYVKNRVTDFYNKCGPNANISKEKING